MARKIIMALHFNNIYTDMECMRTNRSRVQCPCNSNINVSQSIYFNIYMLALTRVHIMQVQWRLFFAVSSLLPMFASPQNCIRKKLKENTRRIFFDGGKKLLLDWTLTPRRFNASFWSLFWASSLSRNLEVVQVTAKDSWCRHFLLFRGEKISKLFLRNQSKISSSSLGWISSNPLHETNGFYDKLSNSLP